ncbi:hypothetical protein BH11PLA2_BH11PLA2_35440 [soil metagenome]
MASSLRDRVRDRAEDRCEYCGTFQDYEPWQSYQVDHIRAHQHHGTDDETSLVWSCPYCNSHKGPNIAGIDPETDQLVRQFNPRTDIWDDHFTIQGLRILGLTPIGRVTEALFGMNDDVRIKLRAELDSA